MSSGKLEFRGCCSGYYLISLRVSRPDQSLSLSRLSPGSAGRRKSSKRKKASYCRATSGSVYKTERDDGEIGRAHV